MPRKKKEPKLYTPESAAEYISRISGKPITGYGIRKAITRGKLKALPVGTATARQWIITEEDLNDWNMHRRKSPGRPPKAD